MKGYKNLVLLALIVGMALSWYSLIHHGVKTQKQYEQYMKAGDKYAKENIFVDALNNYEKANALKKDVKVCHKIFDLYLQKQDEDGALSYAGSVMSSYPKDKVIYEKVLAYYIKTHQYTEAFQLCDQTKAKKMCSKKFQKSIDSIKYTYQILMDGYTEVSPFSQGMAVVLEDGVCSYVLENGESGLSGDYSIIRPKFDDYVIVATNENSASDDHSSLENINEDQGTGNSWEIVDMQGNKRASIPTGSAITNVGALSDGLYAVKKNDKTSFYYQSGKIWKSGFLYAGTMYQGYAAVEDMDGFHILTKAGKMLPGVYESIAIDESGTAVHRQVYFGQIKEKYGLYDVSGKSLGQAQYDEVHPFTDQGRYAAVKQNGKWGFVNTAGKLVISPSYDDARSFSNGLAAVEKDGKWGFIDENNKMVLKPEFDGAMDMSNSGTAFVKKNTIWSLLSLYRLNH
jgi:tetratricopeptide (TPR) repeat protein